MKQLLSFFCALCLVLACTACQNNPANETPAPTKATEPTPATASETPAAQTPAPETPVAAPSPTPTPPEKDMSVYNAPSIALADYPKIDGSTATIPLGVALMQSVTGITREEAEKLVEHNKTDMAYLNLANESADLLIVYAAAETTQQQLTEMDAKFDTAPIGKDALVFLTNAGNPVNSLTPQQIVDIYSGKITNWSKVGGEDKEIVAFQRPDQSGSQTMLKKLVMKDTPLMEAPSEKQPGAMGELIDVVSGYENTANALGFTVYYYINEMYSLPGLKLLSVDGVTPDNPSIQSGDYPYVNDFYAVIRSNDTNSPARQLYDYLTSTDGQKLIEDTGYVPVK